MWRGITCSCCFSLASSTIFMYLSSGLSTFGSSLLCSSSSVLVLVSSSISLSFSCCTASSKSCLDRDVITANFSGAFSFEHARLARYHLLLQTFHFLPLSLLGFFQLPLPLLLFHFSLSFPPLLLIFLFLLDRVTRGLLKKTKQKWND